MLRRKLSSWKLVVFAIFHELQLDCNCLERLNTSKDDEEEKEEELDDILKVNSKTKHT